jgi:hypothetical protein
MYCGIHVYEKLDGMSAWLLGFIALRELLLRAEGLNGIAHAPEIRIAQERDGKAHLSECALHIGGVVHGIC